MVLEPARRFSLSLDYWNIAVDDTIGSITLTQLLANINAFPDRIVRTNGIITGVDLRTGNFGSRRTEGLEVSARAGTDLLGGQLTAGLDGTRILTKKEKLLPNLTYTDLVGVFSLTGDLGLKWKHNAFIGFRTGAWNFNVSQIFRNGYRNFALPGSAARPLYNPRVKDYVIYNAAVSYEPWKDLQADGGRQEPVRQGSALRHHLRQQHGCRVELGTPRRRSARPVLHAQPRLEAVLGDRFRTQGEGDSAIGRVPFFMA